MISFESAVSQKPLISGSIMLKIAFWAKVYQSRLSQKASTVAWSASSPRGTPNGSITK
jgi:hypothetical protein